MITLVAVALLCVACTEAVSETSATTPKLSPTQEAGITLSLCGPEKQVSCASRSMSGFNVFHPRISGAMFQYDIPTTEELIEQGLYDAGASPTHIAIAGVPATNSLRCEWHGTVMTNSQRETTIRALFEIDANTALPPSADLQKVFDALATQMAPQYRDAMQANFNHLVNGGVLEDSRVLTCYVDYAVSEYLLGSGPTTLTVAYCRGSGVGTLKLAPWAYQCCASGSRVGAHP